MTTPPSQTKHGAAPARPKAPDIREKGAPKGGAPQALDRRLFMQLSAFGGVLELKDLVRTLENSGLEGVLYADLNDPRGVGLLTFSEDEDHFLTAVRDFLNGKPFGSLTQKLEYSMFTNYV